jgi:phage FluMu protein Com
MVDAACGYVPGQTQVENPDDVTLRCPTCKDERRVPRFEHDPLGIAVILFKCPKCMKVSPSYDLRYLDKDGDESQP